MHELDQGAQRHTNDIDFRNCRKDSHGIDGSAYIVTSGTYGEWAGLWLSTLQTTNSSLQS